MRTIVQIINIDSSLVVLCSDSSLWWSRLDGDDWRRVKGVPGTKIEKEEERVMSIQNLNLSARAVNGLTGQGVYTVSQLLALTQEDLRKFPSLGRKSIFEIKLALGALNKSLRDDGKK